MVGRRVGRLSVCGLQRPMGRRVVGILMSTWSVAGHHDRDHGDRGFLRHRFSRSDGDGRRPPSTLEQVGRLVGREQDRDLVTKVGVSREGGVVIDDRERDLARLLNEVAITS